MDNETYVFLCGADMSPETIRADPRYGEARFIGIGSIAASDFPAFPTAEERIWGIVLRLAGEAPSGDTAIRLRDGREVRGAIGTDEAAVADLESVVSESRYWELPVAWWQSLKRS
jgi:hypothetical protein